MDIEISGVRSARSHVSKSNKKKALSTEHATFGHRKSRCTKPAYSKKEDQTYSSTHSGDAIHSVKVAHFKPNVLTDGVLHVTGLQQKYV